MENADAVVVCLPPKSQLKSCQHSLQEGHSMVKREIKRCFSAPDHGECLFQNKTVGSSLSDSSESNSSSLKNRGMVGKCSSNVSNYFEICVHKSRADTTTKQNSKKKSKKRWKHKKKLTDDTSVELETRFEDRLNGNSTVETSTVDAYHTDESMTCPATDPNCLDDFNNSMSNPGVCCSDIPKTYSPFVDYMHSLDNLLPSSIQNCTSDYHLGSSDCRMVPAHYPVSSEEEVCCHRNNGNDESSNNRIDGEGLDSVSVSWNGDSGTDIDGLSMKSGVVISSEHCGFSSDVTLSHMNCVTAVINSSHLEEETCNQLSNINRISIRQSITPAKKGKQIKKVPTSSIASRTGNNAIQSRYSRKESNHSVWQRVQKNVGCIDELKNTNTEIYVNSGHEFASAKHSGHNESISKTEGKVVSKTKASGKLKRKTIPGAKGETSCYTRKGSHAVKTSSPNTVNDVKQIQKLVISAEINEEDDCCGAPATSEGTSLCIDTDDFNSSECLEVKLTTESDCLVADTDDTNHKNEVSTETWRQKNGRFSSQLTGVNEPTPTYSVISENTTLFEVDELGISDCNIESNKSSVSASSGVPSSSTSLKCDDDIVVKLRNQVSIGHDDKPVADTDPCKLSKKLIEEAINDVCHIQMESESASRKLGSPIAEFERLLYPATPVICPSFKLPKCEHCVKESDVGTSLCGHESPNISLGNLWKWYEKHGSYGLEVRTDGCEKSTRLGVDCHDHRAYFVPSLSAVQLFGCCENHNVNYTINPSGRTKWSDEPYLVFEFFEFQQPPQRRPLFEKIKELVLGDLQCLSYGDPTSLNSFHLHDLHPISWYAVAWYPIYKIPDGNFRAAFLTYHSPCHLVCRNTTSDPTESSIVSPVLGLQSYNAQGEGWFKAKQISTENVSDVVERRVRSLEKTASVMSKAVVCKGSITSTNRHPDYDFFLSRRS